MNKMWEPEFDDWFENKVSISPCELTTHSSSRNEYGVVMQVEPDDDHPPVDAAIFWTDPMHLYLRYNWGMWYKVATDDPGNCANICKRNSATLFLWSTSSIKNHAVRVYHIDSLPEELFGKPESDTSNSPKATQLDLDLPLSPDDDSGKTTSDSKKTDPAFLAEKIIAMGGCHITHYDREPYQSDFYELNGHFIAASYFDHSGDWLADEESENGDTPVWFGAKGMVTSPVAVACKIRAALAPISAMHLPFHSMVLVNPRCSIINETNYFENWKDRSICLVRQQSICGSELGTVEDALKGFSGTSRPKLVEHASQIQAALDAALAEPSNE